jgi:hypothetical protein
MKRYRVVREGRAAVEVRLGQIVYDGRDMYGVCNDDTRMTGVEHRAYSFQEKGEPWFSMPKCDVGPPVALAYCGVPVSTVETLDMRGVDIK